MAAVRRLGVIFRSVSLSSATRNARFHSQVKDNRCIRRGIAVAVGVAAGGAVLYYYYYSEMCGFREKKAPIKGISCRALLPSLPAVAAKEKVWLFPLFSLPRSTSSYKCFFPGVKSMQLLVGPGLFTVIWLSCFRVWWTVLLAHTNSHNAWMTMRVCVMLQ